MTTHNPIIIMVRKSAVGGKFGDYVKLGLVRLDGTLAAKPSMISERGAMLPRSSTRAVSPPEIDADAGPLIERMVRLRPVIAMGDHVPSPTTIVVPFGAASIAAWMLE